MGALGQVWNVDLDWLKKHYASEAMMAKPGMTVSRWIDGVMEKNEAIDQDSNLRAMFFWGHAPNSQTRGPEMIEAMKKLDLMVVIDPYPSASAAMFAKVRKDGAYLLPVATQFETDGSVTASNRSLQWRERVIEPLFDSRTDHMIMYQLAGKLGFADQFIGKKDGKQLAPGQGQGRRNGESSHDPIEYASSIMQRRPLNVDPHCGAISTAQLEMKRLVVAMALCLEQASSSGCILWIDVTKRSLSTHFRRRSSQYFGHSFVRKDGFPFHVDDPYPVGRPFHLPANDTTLPRIYQDGPAPLSNAYVGLSASHGAKLFALRSL